MIFTDWETGNLIPQDDTTSIVHGSKTVSDLGPYWHSYQADAVNTPNALANQVVYQTQSWFCRPDGTTGAVLWASTTLFPGDVNGEFFMTRGHFHTQPTHGELIIVAKGKGLLLLADRSGNQSSVDLAPGVTYYIDGSLAHRTINTGTEPLIFWCSWPADCGHDYESIESGTVFQPVLKSSHKA